MFKGPNILMIGAAGRDVGKTEFACRLIARYASTQKVIGVKVTTIKERDASCPRGDEGCGVCSSLQQNYCLMLETPGLKGKDTTRMLKAGAHQVYWLRVRAECLEEGIEALLQHLPQKTVVVLESNSARRVLEPGIFIVIRHAGIPAIKPSCAAVIEYARCVIEFDGNTWDRQPEDFVFVEGRWCMPEL